MRPRTVEDELHADVPSGTCRSLTANGSELEGRTHVFNRQLRVVGQDLDHCPCATSPITVATGMRVPRVGAWQNRKIVRGSLVRDSNQLLGSSSGA